MNICATIITNSELPEFLTSNFIPCLQNVIDPSFSKSNSDEKED